MALDVCAATANVSRDTLDTLGEAKKLAVDDFLATEPNWFEEHIWDVTGTIPRHAEAERAIREIDQLQRAEKRTLAGAVMSAGPCAARAALAPKSKSREGSR
jgi:hypothetical protein